MKATKITEHCKSCHIAFERAYNTPRDYCDVCIPPEVAKCPYCKLTVRPYQPRVDISYIDGTPQSVAEGVYHAECLDLRYRRV